MKLNTHTHKKHDGNTGRWVGMQVFWGGGGLCSLRERAEVLTVRAARRRRFSEGGLAVRGGRA